MEKIRYRNIKKQLMKPEPNKKAQLRVEVTDIMIDVFGSKNFTMSHKDKSKSGFDWYLREAVFCLIDKEIIHSPNQVEQAFLRIKRILKELMENFNIKGMSSRDNLDYLEKTITDTLLELTEK